MFTATTDGSFKMMPRPRTYTRVLALEGLIGFVGYEVIHQLEKWGSAILAVLFVVLSLRIV
jgi:purine-cytosine permease-like protein